MSMLWCVVGWARLVFRLPMMISGMHRCLSIIYVIVWIRVVWSVLGDMYTSISKWQVVLDTNVATMELGEIE